MIDEEEPFFDDPWLKAAVRRAFGHETAPARLRQRVTDLLMGSAPIPIAPRRRWSHVLGDRPMNLLAAAAVMFLGIGYMVIEIREVYPPAPTPRIVHLPKSFASAVIQIHDACAVMPDHHQIPGDDFTELGKRLKLDEGVDVCAVSLGNAWEFKGAGLCNIEGTQAAHLLYAKADHTISVMSMPLPSSFRGREGAFYTDVIDAHHAMAAFVSDGGLYCIVASKASGKIASKDVEAFVPVIRASLPDTSWPDGENGAAMTGASPAPNQPEVR